MLCMPGRRPRSPWDISACSALCHAETTRVIESQSESADVQWAKAIGAFNASPRPIRRVEYYGQLVYSDCCIGFPASFPHGFTAMVNFCDGYSGERDRRYLTKADSSQVLSALTEFCSTNRHRLRGWRIGFGRQTTEKSSGGNASQMRCG